MPIDNSSTFFSLIIFINCGKREEEVKMPAIIPITDVVSKMIFLVCSSNERF